MDGWNADQLKKMQLGGNGRVNGFLKQYGIDKDMDIKEKYNSKAAEVSRLMHDKRFHAGAGFTWHACHAASGQGHSGVTCTLPRMRFVGVMGVTQL